MTSPPLRRTRLSALLALLLLAPAPSLAVLIAMHIAPGRVGIAAFAICQVWMILFPAAWYLLIEKGKPSLSPATQGGFTLGAASGLLIAAVILAAYFLLAKNWIDPQAVRAAVARNHLDSRLNYLIGATYWVTLNSLKEEYVFRWFIVEELAALMPRPAAILASAAIFTAHHVLALAFQGFPASATALASTGVFLGGALWSWMYLRYRSLWPAYLSHALIDVAVFTVGWLIIFP